MNRHIPVSCHDRPPTAASQLRCALDKTQDIRACLEDGASQAQPACVGCDVSSMMASLNRFTLAELFPGKTPAGS